MKGVSLEDQRISDEGIKEVLAYYLDPEYSLERAMYRYSLIGLAEGKTAFIPEDMLNVLSGFRLVRHDDGKSTEIIDERLVPFIKEMTQQR